MAVTRIDPTDVRRLRLFVGVERALWGHQPLYWAESDVDLLRRFRGKSAYNRELDLALFLSEAETGAPVGRAVGYVNRRWQIQRQQKAGFIGNFCFSPGASVDEVAELLGSVEAWLRGQGCTDAICGIDGAGALGVGVLSADHDERPPYPLRWHPEEYPSLIEAAGYTPVRRFWTYSIAFDNDLYRTAVSRALDEPGARIRPIDRRRWKREVRLVGDLFNETFVDEWEMNRYDVDEFSETWGQMRWIVDPNTLLIAEVDDEPAGFCVGLPDIAPLMGSLNGRMGPLQILRLLRGARKVRSHGLFVVGVRERFRGRHLAQTLACTLYRHYETLGMNAAAYYYVDDENIASRRVAESLGGVGRIRLHCYQKPL
jgi:ribosomal protein S18 acetylase RimI-like enzyme